MTSAKKFFFEIIGEGIDPAPGRLCTVLFLPFLGRWNYYKSTIFSVLALGLTSCEA